MLKIKAGGHVVYVVSVLEYFLASQNAEGFDDDRAVAFTDTMRRQYGWNTINCAFLSWVDRTVRDTYFYDENDSDRPSGHPSRILAEAPPDLVPLYESVLDTM